MPPVPNSDAMLAAHRHPFRRTLVLSVAAAASIALGAGAPSAWAVSLIVAGTPALTATSVHPGDTLRATTRYTNLGTTPGVLHAAVQTIRRPGQPHDRPVLWDGNFTDPLGETMLRGGQQVAQTGTLTLAPTAPAGVWEIYASWQGMNGAWHDSPSGHFTVTAAPPPPAPSPVPAPTPTPVPDPVPVPLPLPPVVISAPPDPTPAPPGLPAEVTTVAAAAVPGSAAPAPLVTPPATTAFSAAQAEREARSALRRIYRRALTRGSGFTASCARTSAQRRVCTVSWTYRRSRYHGRVVVVRSGQAVTTTVYVTRSRRR